MIKPFFSPARVDPHQQMIEDMNVRGLSAKTKNDDLRLVSCMNFVIPATTWRNFG